jgi:hypothetical protein
MPGPWEKYQPAPADTPQDGPWAKYGAQASSSIPTMTVTAPRETTFERINDFGNDLGDAFVHHLGNIPVGAAQLIAHNLRDRVAPLVPKQEATLSSLITGQPADEPGLAGTLRSLGRKEFGFVDNAVNKLDQYAAKREADYQANVPDSGGSYIGATIGEVLPWLTGAGEARAAGVLPQAATKLGKLGLSAAGGSAIGTTQPSTSGNFTKDKILQALSGAAAAPVAEGVAAGASKLGNVIAGALSGGQAVDPLDKAAAGIITREAENPAALTQAAPSAVPGVTRTLAEETLDPGVARLERNLRSTNKQFDALDRSNNAARVSALEGIAGTDADYAAAQNIRDKVTGQIRDQAFRQGERYDTSRAQQNLMRQAVAHGNQVGSTKGPLEAYIQSIAASNSGRPSVLSTMATVSKAVQDAGDSVGGLYNVRKYIGDLLSGKAGGDTAAAQAASRELMGVRDAIDQELTRRAPSFSRYLTAFQDFSKPINRMDVGRDLMAPSSGSAILDAETGSQVLTPAQFSKKARNLDAVAARATGFAKAKATDILTPQDLVTIKAIQDDLERQAFRSTAGSGGNSQTFERQAVQERIARGAGREALRHVPVLGRYAGDFLDMLDKSRNERVKERLAYLVANPDEARRVLAALPPQGQQIVSNALEGIGAPVARLASSDRQGQDGQ